MVDTLTDKVNDVRLGNATMLRGNLGVLMNAQRVPVVELPEDEAGELFD